MYPSLPTWLVLSAALLPTASAFYPYHYGDGDTNTNTNTDDSTSSPPARLRRTSEHLASANPPSITLPIRRVPNPLRARQNAFNIVNSNEPKQANSVAIDQDGRDLSYMVAVTFGDSQEEYHLLLDSAASNTWVMGQECSSEACKTHNTFGLGDSSTLKTDTTPFSVSYGTGSVSGTLATDTLHIGPLSPSLTFGLATTVSKEFRSYPMDGILGIGRGVKTPGSITEPQVMDVLTSNKLIGAKLYGIHLSRNKDGKLDGELNLGEVNKDRFTGDLNYLDAVENDTGFWEIRISDAGVDGKTVLGPSGAGQRTAIIDTGTSFILMPAADALALHAQIPGFEQTGETFSVPCDSAAVMQFAFNGQWYDISAADWKGGSLPGSALCRSNIIGRQTFSATQWLVGDVFLKNVYSVFDFDARKVAFGVISASANPPASSLIDQTSQSPSPSPTPRPASLDPTAPPESQAQGQKDQTGSAPRISPPTFSILSSSSSSSWVCILSLSLSLAGMWGAGLLI